MKLCQNVRTVSHTLSLKCKIVLLQILLEITLFVYLCSGSSLLHRVFLVGVSRGYSVVVVSWLLTTVTSRCRARVPGREGFSSCGFPALEHMGFIFSLAYWIFQDQGLKPCLLPWQVDALSLSLQRCP